MFRPRKYAVCPVDEATRQWIDQCFAWMNQNLREGIITSQRILVPDFSDFPIVYDGSGASAIKTLNVVAPQMELSTDDILLHFYTEGETQIGSPDGRGTTMFIGSDGDSGRSGGLYWGKNEEDNKYHIGLEIKVLRDPEEIVATLTHEIAHIKLLGEERIEENNEPLTDLSTIAYGLGIFNANCAFKYSQNSRSWGYKKLGYLSQMEWGYALALHAYLRKDYEPDWVKYLCENVSVDFKNSMLFLQQNSEELGVDKLI